MEQMTIDAIRLFLIAAKKEGYAKGEVNIIKEADQSFSTKFQAGNFSFHDNWFGGEPFGGREVVFFKKKPVWMMAYYGSDTQLADGTISFLRRALRLLPDDMPTRGPKELEENGYKYTNIWQGSLERFLGKEVIQYKHDLVYGAWYSGGFINQKEG